MISVSFQYSEEYNLLDLTVAVIFHYQGMCSITYSKGFVCNQPFFHSISMLYLVRDTWQPLSGFFCFFVLFFVHKLLIVMLWLAEAAKWLAVWNLLLVLVKNSVKFLWYKIFKCCVYIIDLYGMSRWEHCHTKMHMYTHLHVFSLFVHFF